MSDFYGTDTHYVGTKKLVDLATGEQFEAQTIVKTIGDKDFKKMFVGAVLDKLDGFSNAKMKFLLWLLDNADRQNRVIGTFRQLSDASGVSFSTVARLIPILKESDVLRLHAPSVYMINPDLVTSVASPKRGALLVKYSQYDHDRKEPNEPHQEEKYDLCVDQEEDLYGGSTK